MKSSTKKHTGRFADTSWTMPLGILAVAGLILSAGCGKSYIRINLYRPSILEQPAWIGVYFLSQESALDDKDNIQLSDPDGIPLGDGVVDKEVYPLYPDDPVRKIRREKFDPQIRWVVVAAGFPDALPCARQRIRVDEDAKLTLDVSVNEDCIDVHIDR